MSFSSNSNLLQGSLGAPTLPIFVHGRFMLPEVLMLYLDNITVRNSTQANIHATDVGSAGRTITEPLVVCPATLHGYHRRQYSLDSSGTQKRKDPSKRGGTFRKLVRKKSFRLTRNQGSKSQLSIPLSSGSVDTADHASRHSELEDEQIASLLSPYILPGPTFDSKVDGVLFWPRSQQEFDTFIEECNAAAVDENDGETKVGPHVLDVEVFLDDVHEQHGNRMVRLDGGKENHHCWDLIKEFDLHQREDPNRPLNQVPEVQSYVQSTLGFRDHAVIQKACWGERLVHPGQDTPESAPETPPSAGLSSRWQSGGELPISPNGFHTRESTLVRAVAFIAGTTPPSRLEQQYELRSAQGMGHVDGDSQVQIENEGGLTVEQKRRVWSYRAGLLQAGKKWKFVDFRDLVVPELMRGVEEAYLKRVVETQKEVEQQGESFMGRLWRWRGSKS